MLEGLNDVLGQIGNQLQSLVSEKPITSAVLGGAVVGTTALGVVKAVKSRRKTKKKTKKTTTKRKTTTKKRKTKLKFGSKAWRKKYIKKGRKKISPKYARTAGKGKDTSTRRIRMTKKGQPYIILASGKARFIKKSSAKRSRKLKGGRY